MSYPNIAKHIHDLVCVEIWRANDEKFSFLLIKFLLVVTHRRVYFSETAFNTQLCLIKINTAISIEGYIQLRIVSLHIGNPHSCL